MNRQIRSLEDSDVSEEMARHFEFLQDEIKGLGGKQNSISEKIDILKAEIQKVKGQKKRAF